MLKNLKKSYFKLSTVFLSMLTLMVSISIIFFCGKNDDVKNTCLKMEIAADTTDEHTVKTFSINDTITTILEPCLWDYIDTLTLTILKDTGTTFDEFDLIHEWDTTISDAINPKNVITHILHEPAGYIFMARAHDISDATLSTDDTIHIISTTNLDLALHPYRRFAAPALPCSISVTVNNSTSDSDYSLTSNIPDAVFSGETLFVWTPEEADSGMKTISITLSDDSDSPKKVTKEQKVRVVSNSEDLPAVAQVKVTERTSALVTLAWDFSAFSDTYLVYRSLTFSGDSAEEFETDKPSFTDTTEAVYFYRIAATTPIGPTAKSEVVIGNGTDNYNCSIEFTDSITFLAVTDTSVSIAISSSKETDEAITVYTMITSSSKEEFDSVQRTVILEKEDRSTSLVFNMNDSPFVAHTDTLFVSIEKLSGGYIGEKATHVVIFTELVPVCRITFDDNGAESGSVPPECEKNWNDTIIIPDNTGNLVRNGYTFDGWNTASNGDGTRYYPGQVQSFHSEIVTLYAFWKSDTTTVDTLTAPSNVTAEAEDTSTIELSWDDNSTNETGFDILKSTIADSVFSVIGKVTPNTTSFNDTGLISGVEYFYTVRAQCADGYSTFSPIASAVTKVSLILSVYESKGGTVDASPNGPLFNRNDTVTITATAVDENHFTGWMGDAQGQDNPLIIEMSSSKSIIASFVNRPPYFSNFNDTDIIAGDMLNYSITTADPDGDNLTLAFVMVPPGASIDTKNGSFSWTPDRGQTGDYPVVCTVEDSEHRVSDSITIHVYAKPEIDSSLSHLITCSGERTVLKTIAAGSEPLYYQWKKNGNVIDDATGDSLMITSVTMENEGIYECTVMNRADTIVSNPCTLEVHEPPSVILQPSDLTECSGDSVFFTVLVSGTPPLTYQWRKNGSDLEGKTDSSFYLASVTMEDTGSYSCRISNECGNINSKDTRLFVTTPSTTPTEITVSAETVCRGTPIVLTVKGGTLGTGAYWEWYAGSCTDSAVIDTGNSVTHTPGLTTTYFVKAVGVCNSTDSIFTTITVKNESKTPDGIKAEKNSICKGDSTRLEVDGGSLGTGASWEWYRDSCDGGDYLRAGPSIVVSPTETTKYSLRGRGDCNSTDWRCITIMVNTPSEAPREVSATNDTICQNIATTLTVNGGSLGTGAFWQWYTESCGETNADTGISITVSPKSTTTYYVRAESVCDKTPCMTKTIYVDSLSIAPTDIAASAMTACPDEKITLTVTGGKLGSNAKWKWYENTCGGDPIDSGTSISVFQIQEKTYYVRAEGKCNTTDCQSKTITMKTGSINPTIAPLASPTVICPGTKSTLIIGDDGNLGTGAKWIWHSGSCDGPEEPENGTRIEVAPEVTTTYFVRAEGDCGYSVCQDVVVNVTTRPTDPDDFSPVTICRGGTATLSVGNGSLGTGGGHWQWYQGDCSGTPIGNNEPTITVDPQTTTMYSVMAIGGSCGNSNCKSVTVTVNIPPTDPDDFSPITICHGGSAILSVGNGSLGTGGGNWQWYQGICGTGTRIDGATDATFTVNPLQTTEYYVVAENGSCGSTNCKGVTVTVNTPPTDPDDFNPITICRGGSVTLGVGNGSLGTGGAHWQWFQEDCSGTPIGNNEPTITIGPIETNSKYSVMAIGGSCGNSNCKSINVSVIGAPNNPTMASSSYSIICNTSTDVVLSVTPEDPGPTAEWRWYSGSCDGSYIRSGRQITVRPNKTTTYYVKSVNTCNISSDCRSVKINVDSYNPYCRPYSNALNSLPNKKILSKSFQIGEF